MSDLPTHRVQQSNAFQHVGMNFFGPILIKEKKFRNRTFLKAYGCVYICMGTKAVHIEIANGLSTEEFLATFRRFIGRRGIPSEVYSDNGTNFVGANNQLKEKYAFLADKTNQEKINSFAMSKNVKWDFNPPASPHFGRIWEAAVKSFKHHLKRVIGEKHITFEESNTLNIEIEAILNSRPLCTISTDPNDPIALTPAHILIGRPLTLQPENNYLNFPENRLTIWRFISRARQDFWKQWHLEYLNELQKRHKWFFDGTEVKEESVVILMDEQSPCMSWPLGVIIELYPGSDGINRVVNVKTGAGTYKRNLQTLCPLPTE